MILCATISRIVYYRVSKFIKRISIICINDVHNVSISGKGALSIQ